MNLLAQKEILGTPFGAMASFQHIPRKPFVALMFFIWDI